MSLNNNTKFRRTTLTINKKINEVVQTTEGFPLLVSILNGFTDPTVGLNYPLIIADNFALMTDSQYNNRLLAFYNYIEATYPFFLRANVIVAPSGTDALFCPLNNNPPPVITAVGDPVIFLEHIAGSTVNSIVQDDYLTWFVQITAPVSQDVTYTFLVNIIDRDLNIFRSLLVTGRIRAGSVTHDSYAEDQDAIYIDEVYRADLSPITVVYVAGSLQFNF